jgi:hypothetical protein
MSLTFAPLETIAAEGLTGLLISAGAKGVVATKAKRATAILAIVGAITQISSGNTVTGLQSLTGALGSSDLDPGEALALQGLVTQLANQASLVNSIVGGTVAGTLAMAIYANIAAGITAACNAEIAAAAAAAPAPTAAPAAAPK